MRAILRNTKMGVLRHFEVNGEMFGIMRGAGFSNLYLIGKKSEFAHDGYDVVAFAVWGAHRNEFSISSLPEEFIPYGILIHELRAANKVYLEKNFGEIEDTL